MAAVLGAATYFALLRIAEAKNEAAVGGEAFALESGHALERGAFDVLRAQTTRLGDSGLADRLERLRGGGALWVAPHLGPERWAVFVETVPRVRRVYIRREALLDPVAHLYRTPRPDVPRTYQDAHAWISLAGALRHELAHYDGVRSESRAYEAELAWYDAVPRSPLFERLSAVERKAWDWGLESAVLSARKARETAAQGLSAPAASP